MTYTVQSIEGCTLIAGSVPASQLAALMRTGGKGAVLSHNLARLAGVQFAWGQPEDVSALETKLRAEKLRGLTAGAPPGQAGLSEEARRWLAVGEQGLSSCSMFWRFTGVKPDYLDDETRFNHPHDPGDLRRCLLLLEQVPEFKGRMGEMRRCSPEWDALVDAWADLCAMLEAEAPDWRNPDCTQAAPETYGKMALVLRSAREPVAEQMNAHRNGPSIDVGRLR